MLADPARRRPLLILVGILGRLGANPVFDRGWTVLGLLLMGLLATVYSFDFWVA